MLNVFLCVSVLLSLAWGAARGALDRTVGGMLTAAGDAVTTAIALAGGFALFCGLIEILSRAGAAKALAGALRPALKRLMGAMPPAAEESVTMNIVSNMLGLGNAATPMGVKASKLLADDGRAGNALCMFLVLNCSSVQLVPSTVIALRAASGSSDPAAIMLPSLIATAVSTVVGVAACKAMERAA